MLVATALTGQRDATACPTSDPAAPATATGPATATVMTSGSVRAEHQAALPRTAQGSRPASANTKPPSPDGPGEWANSRRPGQCRQPRRLVEPYLLPIHKSGVPGSTTHFEGLALHSEHDQVIGLVRMRRRHHARASAIA